jgi:hypothetical protein
MRIYILIVSFFIVPFILQAQKIQISSAEEVIQKISRQGFKATLKLDEKKVERAWENYLREVGKVESSRNIYTVESAKIKAIADKPLRIISKVDANNNQTTIFYALDLGSSYVTRQSSQAEQAEKFLHDFVTKVYDDEFGSELKNAEKMLAIATKQQERKKQEGEELAKELARKKTEHENLQRKLEDNKRDQEKLNTDLEKNKQAQSAAVTEVEKNKKIVEDIRQKFSSLD